MNHPAGTIGIFTDHVARFSDFMVAITGLKVPEGSEYHWTRGVYLAYNTNELIRRMHGEWLFLMDDDHRFEPDLLMKLLDHDKDVVVAHTSKKFPPYESVLYRTMPGMYSADGGKTGGPFLKPLSLHGESGLVRVDACGKPGMLIRRHVLEAMSDPWCEFADGEMGAEDWDFCRKIKDAGFSIYADLDLPLGHMVPMAVYKAMMPSGQWGTSLFLDSEHSVFLADQ